MVREASIAQIPVMQGADGCKELREDAKVTSTRTNATVNTSRITAVAQ